MGGVGKQEEPKVIPVTSQAVHLTKKATDWAHKAGLGLLGGGGGEVAFSIVVS